MGVVAGVGFAVVGGQVEGVGAIQRKGEVGLQGKGSHFGPAQTDFLLHGEGGQQVDIFRRVAQQFNQQGHAEAVVEGFGADARAGAGERRGEGGAHAGFDLARVFRADVNA